MSSPFDVKGVTSRNNSPDSGAGSSSSQMPPPLSGLTGDRTPAATAILPDINQTVEETHSALGASQTGLDGRDHTPPVITPSVPSDETSSERNGPQEHAMARFIADVLDRLGALEEVLRKQRQAYPLQS